MTLLDEIIVIKIEKHFKENTNMLDSDFESIKIAAQEEYND